MMTERQGVSEGKRAGRMLRSVVVSGLAGALVAVSSLSGAGPARASCVGISGINIGEGCNSSFGNLALVLGTGTADASGGFFNAALGAGTGVLAKAAVGALNLALASGTNTSAQAGVRGLDFVNIAFNSGSADDGPGSGGTATSTVEAGNGAVNLAGNVLGNADGGTPMLVRAGGTDNTLGFGTVAANVVADRSDVETLGSLANATNWGNIFTSPNAGDSTVIAGTSTSPAFLSWAFNYQGIFTEDCPTAPCGNTVNATGPLSLVGALGVVKQNVNGGFGITLAGDRTGLEFEDAIKNTYVAIEPWVHYGFELAQYAVGWIPYVGWLAPQIDIFYHFGERIVRSLVFNSADWLWGPLPFGEGLGNIAQDSWNALVQLGRDQWNFWLPSLPPLPPLPGAAEQTTTLATSLKTAQQHSAAPAQVLRSLRERLGLPELPSRNTTGPVAATVHGLIAQAEQALSTVGTEASSIRTALTEAAKDVTGTLPTKVAFGVASTPDLKPTNKATFKAVLQARRQAADTVVTTRGVLAATTSDDATAAAPRRSANHPEGAGAKALRRSTGPAVTASVTRSASQRHLVGDEAKAHRSTQDAAQKKSPKDSRP